MVELFLTFIMKINKIMMNQEFYILNEKISTDDNDKSKFKINLKENISMLYSLDDIKQKIFKNVLYEKNFYLVLLLYKINAIYNGYFHSQMDIFER